MVTSLLKLSCASPHFFTLDICLLYVDASHKPAICLRFTALLEYLIYFELPIWSFNILIRFQHELLSIMQRNSLHFVRKAESIAIYRFNYFLFNDLICSHWQISFHFEQMPHEICLNLHGPAMRLLLFCGLRNASQSMIITFKQLLTYVNKRKLVKPQMSPIFKHYLNI